MIAIVEDTCERAWLAAAEHLLLAEEHTGYNLIVEVRRPALHDDADRRIRASVDRFLRKHQVNPVATVAGTIFPAAQYRDYGVRGVFEVYPDQVYPEIVRANEWGRYAQRLVRWPPSGASAILINPLQQVIQKIIVQLKGGRKRACYEVSLSDSAIDLPLYDPASDGRGTMGGPCLSHISFKLGADSSLYLTALYRSHYYIARALGNFLGLAALQAFVCDQTRLSPASLLCVSSYAKLDTLGRGKNRRGWGIVDARNLVTASRKALTRRA